jgi:hypothetical protein
VDLSPAPTTGRPEAPGTEPECTGDHASHEIVVTSPNLHSIVRLRDESFPEQHAAWVVAPSVHFLRITCERLHSGPLARTEARTSRLRRQHSLTNP